jgi:eukaryotic-like serine/threonine-protein kinase
MAMAMRQSGLWRRWRQLDIFDSTRLSSGLLRALKNSSTFFHGGKMSSSTKYMSLLVLVILAISLSACQPAGSQIPQETQVTPEIAATDEPIEQVLTPENTEAEVAAETPTPDSLPTDIIDAKGVTMRLVPAGTFTMGSDKQLNGPIHQVSLPDYYLDMYEVTNALYKACVEDGGCSPTEVPGWVEDERFSDHPVFGVDWEQAQQFCQWRGARLPTEAEWEKAARGTDARTYPWGEGFDCQRANVGCDNFLSPVGSYPQGVSPYGMHDMAGNAWEWVADWFGDYDTTVENAFDPQGPTNGEYRVVRGGQWSLDADVARSFDRGGMPPDIREGSIIGIRCALSSQIAAAP